MRTIKFLVFPVVVFTAVPAFAQGGLQPGAFPRIDRFARIEARRIEARHTAHRQVMRHVAAKRIAHMRMVGRFGVQAGTRAGLRAGTRPGFRAGTRAGLRAGTRAGFRMGRTGVLRANATPEMQAFREQLLGQRRAIQAQVRDGKLTREQAHTQLRRWITEHRPDM